MQAQKLFRALATKRGREALRHGVAATGGHQYVLERLAPTTVLDVGANRGQFALDVERALPNARVHSFEPIPHAAETYRKIFSTNPLYTVTEVALGAAEGTADLHVSRRDDSSSLLPIGPGQTALFPGTEESGLHTVPVATLDQALGDEVLPPPVLLKIDVQGFELEVLRGAVQVLRQVRWVYVECSFEELYSGQALASDVTAWLGEHRFRLAGLGSVNDIDHRIVQADLLFEVDGHP